MSRVIGFVGVVVIVLLAGCVSGAEVQQVERWWANDVISELIYTRDPRTGFCFAVFDHGLLQNRVTSVTVVPCERIPANLLK